MQTSGLRVWLILWKAYEAMREHARAHIESLELCLSDFGVLEVLLHKGPTPVNAIGEKIGLTSGSITTAVDRLERKGLVERREDAGDRRARVVHPTAAGKKLITSAFAEHEAAMERAASGLTAVERTQFVALAKKLGLEAQRLLR
jgi:MarR family 2-MHQ and catechol resistance regulon transcriptional repressor